MCKTDTQLSTICWPSLISLRYQWFYPWSIFHFVDFDRGLHFRWPSPVCDERRPEEFGIKVYNIQYSPVFSPTLSNIQPSQIPDWNTVNLKSVFIFLLFSSSEVGCCVNYGRPLQTTDRNQCEESSCGVSYLHSTGSSPQAQQQQLSILLNTHHCTLISVFIRPRLSPDGGQFQCSLSFIEYWHMSCFLEIPIFKWS